MDPFHARSIESGGGGGATSGAVVASVTKLLKLASAVEQHFPVATIEYLELNIDSASKPAPISNSKLNIIVYHM